MAEEHEHEHDEATRPPRSTVHDVLRSAGRPLDAPVRTEMETRLGADFSDVRVHDDTAAQRSATEVGARAYTSGSHVVLGQGGGDRHTLAHELTHVIQQRHGPVSGTDNGSGLSVSDPSDRFERAAEANATRALAGDVGSAPAVQRAAEAEESAPQAGAHGVAVQRAVRVGFDVFSDEPARAISPTNPVRSAADLMAEVEKAVETSGDRTLIEQFHANRAKVEDQARKWVADSQVGSHDTSEHAFGRKRHQDAYHDFVQVGRALVGWVLQKPGRHEEKVFANQLVADPDLAADLDTVLGKVRTWIEHLGDDPSRLPDPSLTVDVPRIMEELASGQGEESGLSTERHFGTYQRHFDRLEDTDLHTAFGGDFMAVLNRPGDYTVRDKMVVLHDLYEYFRPQRGQEPETAGRGLLPAEPAEAMRLSSQAMGDDGTAASRGPDRGSRRTTRDEDAPSTRMAREHRIPVTAGQSFTASRMLHLSSEAGATGRELNSVALGLFAFWRIDYDQTVELAAHTLHEVLDIAANFGVPYNMKVPQRTARDYPEVMARRAKRTNDKLAEQLDPLRHAVEDLKRGKSPLGADRRKRADDLFKAYARQIADCEFKRAAAEQAPQDQAQEASTAYANALRQALGLYAELCELLKAKRVQDALTEDDRDAIGASGVPEATV
ncbi:DUF4157 domain-containing protein [Streptomyces sp. B6B3]|uniref:eCIS core domain-containing protein n=1 Tax=Streptomyces sp. B6B3 TaxID=3153570 RepID=UPI00325E14FE